MGRIGLRIAIATAIGLAVYVLFIYMPGVFGFFTVFRRKKCIRLTEESMKGTYYEPFAERILAARKRIEELPGETITVKSGDGILLSGHYVDCGSDQTVLFAHGFQADPIDQLAVAGTMLYDRGYNLLFICQRAHGDSGGRYTALGILEQYDIIEWVRELEKRGCERILLYGMSMGCAAISYALDKLGNSRVSAAILDCGFESPYQQMREDCRKWHVPRAVLYPAMVLTARIVLGINMKASVQESLQQSVIPALFLHGTADESVPVRCGRENYARYGGPKDALFVEGAAHTVSLLAGGAEAEEKVMDFIRKYI